MDQLPRGHAIVYGASGLIGWSVVDQLLGCDSQLHSFSTVTAMTNRTLDLTDSFWTPLESSRIRLQLVSGVDLGRGDGNTLAESLKRSVKDVESVTHIYYVVFTSAEDDVEEVAINQRMLQNVVYAHSLLSPGFRFLVFPGGTRGYGIYAPGGTLKAPLIEEMVDRIPPDYAKTVVYPMNRELLRVASEGKGWTWCEVCPDAIIGFTPNGSQFSLALHWAQYLSLYAFNNGIGLYAQRKSAPIEIPFPGNVASYNALFSPVSATTIGQFMIHASLHPETYGNGQLFNIAESSSPTTFREIWPQLAKWFGLVGVGPVEEVKKVQESSLGVGQLPDTGLSLTPGQYIAKHKGVFTQCGLHKAIARGVGAGAQQLDSVGYWLNFDRQLSLEKLRAAGFKKENDPVLCWLDAFRMFREAGIIL